MTFQEQVQLKVIACQTLGPNASQDEVEQRFNWLIADAIQAAIDAAKPKLSVVAPE